MTVTATTLPMVLAEVEVASVVRLSPTFVRVELRNKYDDVIREQS